MEEYKLSTSTATSIASSGTWRFCSGYGECSRVMEVIGIGTGEGLEDVIDELGREGEDGCCL